MAYGASEVIKSSKSKLEIIILVQNEQPCEQQRRRSNGTDADPSVGPKLMFSDISNIEQTTKQMYERERERERESVHIHNDNNGFIAVCVNLLICHSRFKLCC